MPDRAQDTEAIRAALPSWGWQREYGLTALGRLVARLEAAERERDEALKRVTNWENAQVSVDAFAGAEHRRAEAAERLIDAQKRVIRCYEAIEYERPVRESDAALLALRLARAALAAAAPGAPNVEGVDERSSPGSSSDAPGENYPGSPAPSAAAAPGETEQTP